jgi:hypothetical protein
MRKFVDPLAAGGAPVFNTELNGVLNRESWFALEQVIGELIRPNENVIVNGGLITDNGNGTMNITSGMAYFGGAVREFMEFDAGNNIVHPAYLVPSTPVIEQIEFADTVDRDYIKDQRAEFQAGFASISVKMDVPVDNSNYISNVLALQSDVTALFNNWVAEAPSRPDLVANVDEAGNISISFALSGTWAVSKPSTGNYVITQNGGVPANTAVLITPTEVTGTIGIAAKYKPSLGIVQTTNINTGSEIDSGFTIVIYPV